MKNKELFDRTIAILVKAYQNDTLRHGSCAACAVGNLIAGNTGINIKTYNNDADWETDTYRSSDWYTVLMFGKTPTIDVENQITSTGYSISDLLRIENAFESVGFNDDRMFSGLMSVCDTLMEIHEAGEVEIQEAKSMFVCTPT